MENSLERNKRDKLKNILTDLAASQNSLEHDAERKNVYCELEELYSLPRKKEHFRHYYSDIFEVLTSIKNSEKQESIDVLGQNLKILYENYTPSSKRKVLV